jgi:hypothetical protein
MFNIINIQPWGNPRLAKSLVGVLVTSSFIVGYVKWLWLFNAAAVWHWIIVDYATWFSAYYLVDGSLLVQYHQDDAYNFIVHHIVSLKLIQAHVENVFSVTKGIQFLALFEFSNLFMQMFQMCHWQGWERAKRVLVYPFVVTYVPLRLIAIPYYSIMHYSPTILRMKLGGMLYYGLMLLFVNAFSIFYALVVANKFRRHVIARGQRPLN